MTMWPEYPSHLSHSLWSSSPKGSGQIQPRSWCFPHFLQPLVFFFGLITYFPSYQISVRLNISLRFKGEMYAIHSGIWKLGPQLVVLFVEVMGPLWWGALLKEIYYRGQALRFYNLVPLPLSSLSLASLVWVISWHPVARSHSCFLEMVDSIPLELYAKINPFLLKVLQVLQFIIYKTCSQYVWPA